VLYPAVETEKTKSTKRGALKGSSRRGAGVVARTRSKSAGKVARKQKAPVIAEKYVTFIYHVGSSA